MSCLHDIVERPDQNSTSRPRNFGSWPARLPLVLMDGATTTEAAPPFAIFEGWVPRTMVSGLGGQYHSLHVVRAAVMNE